MPHDPPHINIFNVETYHLNFTILLDMQSAIHKDAACSCTVCKALCHQHSLCRLACGVLSGVLLGWLAMDIPIAMVQVVGGSHRRVDNPSLVLGRFVAPRT